MILSSILSVSSRTVRKIINRLIANENLTCCVCGWSDGSGDLHHIKGKKVKNANSNKNLSYVCPNCHRLIHQKKIDEKLLTPFSEQIGNKWKKYYNYEKEKIRK
jgi:predicted HNH restriction endonuclease